MENLTEAIQVLKKIESQGYLAYVVGGAVRDYVLKIQSHDIDIATNMPLEKIKESFVVKETGVQYGGVTVIWKKFSFEITHFRRDLRYTGHRYPDIAEVERLEEDILRRDFTVNALAMDSKYNIIDLAGGLSDIENHRIRCIGNADERFEEDALRILRALYFSAQLNFEIEKDTLTALKKQKHLLSSLSDERIYAYFVKILYAKTTRGIEYINSFDLFADIPVYKRWLAVINRSYAEEDLAIYYFLRYGEYPPLISHEDKKRCLVAQNLIEQDFDVYSLYKNQNFVYNLMDIFANLGYDIRDIGYRFDHLRIKEDKDLELSKREIAGLFQGKKIAIAIDEVIRAILEGRLDNDKTAILIFLQGLDVVEC